MLENMNQALMEANKRGTQTILDELALKHKEIFAIEHLIKVHEFCELLWLIYENYARVNNPLKLELKIININNFYFLRHKLKTENEETVESHILERDFPNLNTNIAKMLDKFTKPYFDFIDKRLIDNPIIFPITKSGFETFREYMLTKEMYVAYQHNCLKMNLIPNQQLEINFPIKI